MTKVSRIFRSSQEIEKVLKKLAPMVGEKPAGFLEAGYTEAGYMEAPQPGIHLVPGEGGRLAPMTLDDSSFIYQSKRTKKRIMVFLTISNQMLTGCEKH